MASFTAEEVKEIQASILKARQEWPLCIWLRFEASLLPAACLCSRASLSMLKVSSDCSSMSAPGHGEPERQRRERAEEAGLALDGGVRGELES